MFIKGSQTTPPISLCQLGLNPAKAATFVLHFLIIYILLNVTFFINDLHKN